MSGDPKPNAKVLFRIRNEDGGEFTETLWAISMDGDLYELANSPFFAYGVSWQDVVFAPLDPREGMPTFQSVVTRSGNRTVRIRFELPLGQGHASDALLQGLTELGCDYEGANRHYISLNIPKEVNLQDVRSYLIANAMEWEHADPTYQTLFPDEP